MMMDGAEWSSFNGANSVNEEADFMAQLFPNCSPDSNDIESSNAALSSSCYSDMTGGDNGSYFANGDKNSNFYCLSQGSSSYSDNSGNVSFPFQGTYSLSDAYEFFPVEYCPSVAKHFVQHFPGNLLMERNEQLSLEMSSGGSCEDQTPEFSVNKNVQTKQECDQMSEFDPAAEDRITTDDLSEYGRKRSRISEKGRRNIRTKKNQKNGSDDDGENNRHPNLNRQNSSSCSEEEFNGSQELSGVASSSLSSKGNAAANDNRKTRASRGAATDPQSLYARKRRERINERLKILQNLVPNGTKVDISTMLEEAVHYVKFLQDQIKLLSSDELWMYAPLAYNGVDIGLDPKIRALL